MDALKIVGGTKLQGRVSVGGAKNACLPLMAATLLVRGKHRLRNVPRLADVNTMIELLRSMGCVVTHEDTHTLIIDTNGLERFEAPYELVRTMRASVLVLGPLVSHVGRCKVSLPGGCAIGARPIDQHLKGLAALGAQIELVHGYVEAKATKLIGASFTCDMVTVTGTENLLMAAVLASGTTTLRNSALEPEIVDLADALRQMGAQIRGDGTSEIVVEGVNSLQPLDYAVMPDRIEAGTFVAAAAMTGGDIVVEGGILAHLGAVADRISEAGVVLTAVPNGYRVQGPPRLKAVDITTLPYPGFATDMQAQFMAMMTTAEGAAHLRETVFENRYMHVPELQRMGANIVVDGASAWVRGVAKLQGATVMATDLRASASLVLAGLCADGETNVRRIYHLDRGYEALEQKLSGLGAQIVRYSEQK